MVCVRPGRVMLSDRRTRSSWPVEVEPFQLFACSVTQSWYVEITGRCPSGERGGRLPVTGVSWWDAVEFCNTLSRESRRTPAYRIDADAGIAEWDTSADGYRLPTEAEWEHACRAGTYRVLRGGGWADEHWSCRASVRRRSHPSFRIDDVGFRVARSLPQPEL